MHESTQFPRKKYHSDFSSSGELIHEYGHVDITSFSIRMFWGVGVEIYLSVPKL